MLREIDKPLNVNNSFYIDGTYVAIEAKFEDRGYISDFPSSLKTARVLSIKSAAEDFIGYLNKKMAKEQLDVFLNKNPSAKAILIDKDIRTKFNKYTVNNKHATAEQIKTGSMKDIYYSQDYLSDNQYPLFKSRIYIDNYNKKFVELNIPVQALHGLIFEEVKIDQINAVRAGVSSDDIDVIIKLDLTPNGIAELEKRFVNRSGLGFAQYDVSSLYTPAR